MTPPRPLTVLLNRWAAGSEEALGELMPLVVEELRTLARHHLARASASTILQPTVLVNEAYLRLVDAEVEGFEDRRRFFAFASRVIRDVLFDHARARRSQKRGGAWSRVDLEEAAGLGDRVDLDTWLEIDQSLRRLESTHPRQARVVEMRLFGGLKIAEIADLSGRSRPTVERDWALGRRRLARDLGRD